jgi:hypothetical protein
LPLNLKVWRFLFGGAGVQSFRIRAWAHQPDYIAPIGQGIVTTLLQNLRACAHAVCFERMHFTISGSWQSGERARLSQPE